MIQSNYFEMVSHNSEQQSQYSEIVSQKNDLVSHNSQKLSQNYEIVLQNNDLHFRIMI